jgi:hypothetical protein
MKKHLDDLLRFILEQLSSQMKWKEYSLLDHVQ